MKPLVELQSDSTTFSIGRALSDGWSLVSKFLGFYILGGILTIVIGAGAGMIPFLGSIANNLVLAPCFMAGAIYITWRISNGIGWTDFADMFKGFNLVMPVLISTLIKSIVSLALFLVFFASYIPQIIDLFKLTQGSGSFKNQDEIRIVFEQMFNLRALFLLLGYLVVVLFISVLWAFMYHFIVIYKMDAWPAMEMSRKLARHNLWPLTGLMILLFLIILVSALPCGIGLLFSLPLSIGALYSAFAQITHCDQPDEINKEMFDFIGNEKG
jgi:uncharacterized membrane protein